MRFLVVTLHAGEAEFDRCVAAIHEQSGVDVEHVVISGLSNHEAHRCCYETIEGRSDAFDVAAKIDADMVLRSPGVLEWVGRLFAQDRELDHAQLALHDFYTDRSIMGMQAFSPRVRWERSDEGLFVDPSPVVPGRRAVLWHPPMPVADHSPDPSRLQAFRFGVHRAQKAVQRDRQRIRGSQARDQWRTLIHTWDAFVRTSDTRRGLAVYGADRVLRNDRFVTAESYRSSTVEAALAAAPDDAFALRAALEPLWSSVARRTQRRVLALGPTGTARLAGALVRERYERRRPVEVDHES